MKQTILLMDNDDRFLEVYSASLADEGYEVIAVNNIIEAEEKLAPHTIHLAILDVRMEDDRDENDISGLKLAEEQAYQGIPKIILTAHPSWQYAEKALGAALEGIQIVGMASKANGPDALLELIQQAFEKHHFYNEQLVVRWNQASLTSFPSLVLQLDSNIKAENLSVRSGEMEALFRRLFYESEQITISHLFKQNEEMLFLGIVSYSTTKKERHHLVTCGYKDFVAQEREHFEIFVSFDSNSNRLIKEREADTSNFSGTSYVLPGMELNSIVQFSEFYKKHLVEDIIQVLDHLFSKKLSLFYKQGRSKQEQRVANKQFAEKFRLKKRSLQEWEVHVTALCEACLASGLARVSLTNHELHWEDERFQNLVPFLFQMPTPLLNISTLYGLTFGKLNSKSILLNEQTDIQLIDCSHLGEGALIGDFVVLETAVKHDLLNLSNVDTIYEMEKRLININSLEDAIDCHEFELEVQKAIKSIGRIRQHVVEIVGHSIEPYLIGLYFYSMAKLATFDLSVHYSRHELLPFLHALLTATFVCEKLSPRPASMVPVEYAQSLWIDDKNNAVHINGRKIDLTVREFSLLDYLYKHKDQLCDRIDIAEAVFEWVFDEGLTAFQKRKQVEDFINSTMSRLRKKVEINPKHQYIVTERGIGYRLQVNDTNKIA